MTRETSESKPVYYLIAFLIPVAFFALLEIGLRLAGYGVPEALFVDVPNAPGYLQPNEDVVERFFATAGQAPRVSIDTTYLHAEKPADSFRIVVQGGSSAAGFPYGKWASPAGMLQQRLRRTFPYREVEVISTAMSAVNSYTLLDFADEIVAIEPDVVLIYAGHNEFLGVLGVGSAFASSRSRALTLAIMAMRKSRVFVLLERAYARVAGNADVSGAGTERPGTLMARIAGERRIPYGSPLFEQGEAQFRANLNALLEIYADAGIRTFVATIASNEHHQAPLTSGLTPDTDADAWGLAYEQALAALDDDRAAAAVAAFEELTALDDGAADAWYGLGRAREAAGDPHGARDAYRAARDRDQLRFRAPGSFNDIIRDAASRHGATLVDAETVLAEASPDGIIGKELMLEHLHPNVRGYFLLADAFYDALREDELIGPWDNAPDDETAWRQSPVTAIDALGGEYRVQRLLADWPFRDTYEPVSLPPARTEIERIAQAWYQKQIPWQDAMNQAMVYYQRQGDVDNAARIAVNLAEAFHFLDNAQMIAGQLLLRQGDRRLALRYLDRAARLAPRKVQNLLALAQGYYFNEMYAQARQTLSAVLAVDPGNATAKRLIGQLDSRPKDAP